MSSLLKTFILLGAATHLMLHTGCSYSQSENPGTPDSDSDSVSESGSDDDDADSNDTETETAPDCDPSRISTINSSTSPVIRTVGIVEWTTEMTPVHTAFIEFGVTADYGHTAPVDVSADLSESPYRTLLLGMKPSSVYHYRIVVNGCPGEDHVIETGALSPDLPSKTVDIQNADLLSDGFIVASTGMKSNYAYIMDKDGDYVWWYAFHPTDGSERMDGIARARMSADGRFMWAGSINVGCGCGRLFRIPMDGIGLPEVIDVDQHHDMTVLPDNAIAYIEYTDDGDRIVERSESGETRTVYQLNADFAGEEDGWGSWSHCNAIHYWPKDHSYTVSCLNLRNIIRIDRPSGRLVWNLAGDGSGDFSGMGWETQHGHQILDNGNILVLFNTGATADRDTDNESSTDAGAAAVELTLDFETGKMTEVWRYVSGHHSSALGDVQRIANGNTLVTYSLDGIIHEVSPTKKPVRIISVDGLGYANWRSTLYGPPNQY